MREQRKHLEARLALLDWDGTLRPGYMVVDWCAFLASRGIANAGTATELGTLARLHESGRVGYVEFADRILDQYAAGVRGVQVTDFERAAVEFAVGDEARLFPLARRLIPYLKSSGLEIVIISGSPIEPLLSHAGHLGVREVYGSELEVTKGRFSGRVRVNMAQFETKARVVAEIADARSVVFAAGNSPADEPMLRAAYVAASVNESTSGAVQLRDREVVRLSPTASVDDVARKLSNISRCPES